MSSFLVNLKENLHPASSYLVLIILSIFVYKWLLANKKNKQMHLPPSPPKFPLIGHLHRLGTLPHHSLRSISNKYGDIILLYLGHKPTLVVSSSKYAQEIMKTHDLVFANRPLLRFIKRIFYDYNDIAFNSYCAKWRHMKSICVLQVLNKKKVNSFRSTREEEVALVIDKIKNMNGSVIDLREIFMEFSNALISRTALGAKYTSDDKEDLPYLIKDLMEVLGAVSIGDYIPMLGWIDKLRGMEERVESLRKKFDDFLENVVQLHEARRHNNNNNNNDGDEKEDQGENNFKDFVDVLLDVQREQPEHVSRDDIKAIILDIFLGGIETSSTTLEWTMLELLRHPQSMRTLQEEVRRYFRTNSRVTEDELDKMKYLDAVIMEILRLHPPGPLLIFRECYKDVKIDNYDILSRTQVIINAWAIQRDPTYWQDPEQFIPERFLTTSSSIDYMGQNFNFIPFGAGRRGCPGVSYGVVKMKLILASLVYEFNWTLPNGRDGTTLDVQESAGITVRPLNSLKVIASPNVVF